MERTDIHYLITNFNISVTDLQRCGKKTSLFLFVLNIIWYFIADGVIILLNISIVVMVWPYASLITTYLIYDFVYFVLTYGGMIDREDEEDEDEVSEIDVPRDVTSGG